MQLHQLRAFVAIADAGSISGAAKTLDVSQPAVTRALQQLEVSVGASLLARTAHGAELTECGQAFLQYARNIVREVIDAQTHVRQLAGDRSGRLSIASSAVPFSLIVPRAIEVLRLRFPDVHIQMKEAVYPTVLELFREREIDFAIGPLPNTGLAGGFRRDHLFDLDLVVALKRGHPKARARSLRDLVGLPWLVTGPIAGPGAVHTAAFVDAGLEPPRCVMHCESVGGAIQIIEHSGVASFVPRHLAEEAQAAELLTIVPVQEKLPALEVFAFMPAQKMLTPAGQALWSAMHSVSRALRPKNP